MNEFGTVGKKLMEGRRDGDPWQLGDKKKIEPSAESCVIIKVYLP